ncbi:very short patch repair endonuclease [Cellulosimicrobium cellulans]|uniref:very short patch repair endonuclease n=1 Tax=Cellulosimicrobium cellulans TaxID=1710 RepID=UPI0027DD02A0|nr:very short patch repair endonuclease [Cellulosimicrobium cellulans]
MVTHCCIPHRAQSESRWHTTTPDPAEETKAAARAGSRASSPAARRRMQANRRRDTAPEMDLRRAAYALGLRYRVDARPVRDLNRRADMVFAGAKVAVFVDGCFWHGCPQHGTNAKQNAAFWRAKITQNRARDADTNARLEAAGWAVVRVWEHEDSNEAAVRLATVVSLRRRRRPSAGPSPQL